MRTSGKWSAALQEKEKYIYLQFSFKFWALAAHLSLLVKTQDIIAHTAGPAALHFMFVSKELLASEASTIVQLTMGQNPQQSALPRVHIPYHRHPGDKRKNKNRWEYGEWGLQISVQRNISCYFSGLVK